MPRTYKVTFEAVAVSAAQDLLQIKGATGKMLRIKRVWWKATDTTVPTAQMLQTRCRVLPATVTDGNGSAGTASKVDQGDANATFTAIVNSTTKAATSGTAVVEEQSGDHVQAGYDFPFDAPPTVPVNASFVFELLSTPSGTLHLSGGATVEEIG